MQNFIAWISGYKTKGLGSILSILGVVVALGLFTPELRDEAMGHFSDGLNHIIGLAMSIAGLISVCQRSATATEVAKLFTALGLRQPKKPAPPQFISAILTLIPLAAVLCVGMICLQGF